MTVGPKISEHIEIRHDAKPRHPFGNYTDNEYVPDVYDLLENLHPAWQKDAACRGMGRTGSFPVKVPSG